MALLELASYLLLNDLVEGLHGLSSFWDELTFIVRNLGSGLV